MHYVSAHIYVHDYELGSMSGICTQDAHSCVYVCAHMCL